MLPQRSAGGVLGSSGSEARAMTRWLTRPTSIRQVAVVFWILVSAFLLLGISVVILGQTNFPLDVGLIRTKGRTGLWATLVPALVGLAGLSMLPRFRRLGAAVLVLYSAYWATLAAGGLPAVWNAQSSFCLKSLNFCITSPWIARMILIGVTTSFILTGLWSLRQAIRARS
jgi:hypothetical protein